MKPATSLTWSQAPLGCDLRELGADGPAEAVLAGLEHHHVDAVGGAVGEFGALAGLEVEPVAFALLGLGVLQDLGDRDVEDLVAVVGAGEALEHRGDRARIALGHLGLDVDVGEHAPGNRVLQTERVDHVLQRAFSTAATLATVLSTGLVPMTMSPVA